MKDINSREDVYNLVTTFYQNVLEEVMLAPVFIATLGNDMNPHYERMTDFWEDQLLDSFKFDGNPMKVHLEMAHKFNLDNDQFDIWLQLFNMTVDSLYAGPKAEKAKEQATNIATVMRVKMNLQGS